MAFTVSGINHFGLSVADLDDSIKFYTEILGLKISEKREHDCFFSVGDSSVFALLQYPGGSDKFDTEMRPTRKGKAFTHFGFAAPSIEDVFEFQGLLEEKNIEITKKAYERWDGASVYFIYLNGYTIEFIYFDPTSHAK